jgi:glycosyltransferase involved in cell wall biosynthesis
MRVLVVASFNKGRFAPFIIEQAEALKEQGCEIEFFGLQGKGLRGYLNNVPQLKQKIREFRPDVIHAHYGLSGLFANLQREIPVVTTYHGSDINDKSALPFSKMAIRLSGWNIFVSRKIIEIAKPKKNYSLLSCGIDLHELQQMNKSEARQRMNLEANKRYVLFSGAFDNEVKNAPLARKAMEELCDPSVVLLELKGYSREEVTLLMCAVDALLMTSFTEGSPQVIKEALACGCPIVSVDVGDVKERIDGVDGCYVAETRHATELASLLQNAMGFEGKTKGRERVISDQFDNRLVSQQLMKIFKIVCRK